MKLLLLAATAFEIEPLISKKPEIDVLIGGVGVPSTIYQLTKQLNNRVYDMVIQAGIAGTFVKGHSLGETVMVKQDTFADLGVEEKGNLLSIFDMGLAGANEFPFSNGWLMNPNAVLDNIPLKTMNAVTVNQLSDQPMQNEWVYKKYNAELESMEGAALHYVCLQQKVPFLQVRSISNYIGERDKTKWKMAEAIGNLNEALLKHILPACSG